VHARTSLSVAVRRRGRGLFLVACIG